MFKDSLSCKGIISRKCKELKQPNRKNKEFDLKININPDRLFSKKDMKMVRYLYGKCPSSSTIRECEQKPW